MAALSEGTSIDDANHAIRLRSFTLPVDERENERWKSAKHSFLFQVHSHFLCNAAGRCIIGMNKRNHAPQLAPRVVATVHPSSLLRQPDEESRERE